MTEAITAPKGLEKSSVFVGTPTENVRFDATIPFWMKPSFTQEQAPGGFLQKGMQPKLEIKASALPVEAIPSSSKVPYMAIDADVYDRFSQEPNTNLELIQATRDKFPGYDKFNPTEKEYAKRNVLYDKLTTLDQSQFYPTASTRAPITNVNIDTKEKIVPIDRWSGIENIVAGAGKKNMAAPVSKLPSETQKIIIDIARDVTGVKEYNQGMIALKKNPDGEVSIVDVTTGQFIAPLNKKDVNLAGQPTAEGKKEVLKEGNISPETKYKIKGTSYSYKELKNAGWSDADIKRLNNQ